MNNGVGYTPVIEHRKPPVLGTDGIGADMWREARTALFKSNDAGLALPMTRPAGNVIAIGPLRLRDSRLPLGSLGGGSGRGPGRYAVRSCDAITGVTTWPAT